MANKLWHLLVVSSLLLLALAVPAGAQTQYLLDNTLDANPGVAWAYGDSNDHQYVTDRCAISGSTWAARLDAGYGIAQEFNVTSAHVSYSIRLDAYFGDTGGTSDDAINVYVRNLNTNVEEVKTFTAADYGYCASVVGFTLSNDYDNAPVRVTVKRSLGSTSSMTIDVDNIYFFGRPY